MSLSYGIFLTFLQIFLDFLYNLYAPMVNFLSLAPKAAQDPPLRKDFKPSTLRAIAPLATKALAII